MNKRLLRKHFHALHLRGYEVAASIDRSRPVIFFGNHSNWWDGLIEFFLSREVFGFDSYLMMDELQMRRYRFFRWIGAFSVNRSSPREAMKSVQYIISILKGSNRALWIYPQGTMLPNDTRPLLFESGIARIVESIPNAHVIPVAHKYEFLMEQRPEAFTRIGRPVDVTGPKDRKTLLALLEKELTVHLESVARSVARGELDTFHTILAGRKSTNVLFDRARMMRNSPEKTKR